MDKNNNLLGEDNIKSIKEKIEKIMSLTDEELKNIFSQLSLEEIDNLFCKIEDKDGENDD